MEQIFENFLLNHSSRDIGGIISFFVLKFRFGNISSANSLREWYLPRVDQATISIQSLKTTKLRSKMSLESTYQSQEHYGVAQYERFCHYYEHVGIICFCLFVLSDSRQNVSFP